MNNVDTPQQPVTCLEWFFGYGGNHLGLKRAIPNLRLIAACEIEAYACANVVAKMEAGLLDPAPLWTNCKTFPLAPFRGLVDIFIASYPCQGFSSAGKREGQKDPRFLWPWVLRAIAVIQPRYCFFENVDAHVSLGLSTVLSDLEEAGYRHASGIYSAAECGAPQQRKRVFILAERKSLGCGERWAQSTREQGRLNAPERGNAELANAECSSRCAEQRFESREWQNGESQQVSMPDRTCETRASDCGGQLENAEDINRRIRNHAAIGEENSNAGRSSEKLANTKSPDRRRELQSGESPANRRRGSTIYWPNFVSRPGQPQHAWEPARVIETQRGLGGGVNGRAANVDRLRLLGNGVYPAAAERAFRELSQKLNHA